MDLNGIAWVGNIYQKFEAMCLEVEEIMYQDTVKYVENQVQTVGASMKKFYSDVMQDLLPTSSMEPEKGVVSDLPLQIYADVGIYTKPKGGIKKRHEKVDDIEQLTEDPKVITDNKLGHAHTFHRFLHVDNLFALQGHSAGGISRRHRKGSLSNQSNLGTCKNFRRENLSPNVTLGLITPLDKDFTRPSSSHELPDEYHEASFDQKARITTPGSVEITGHDFMEKSKNEFENAREDMHSISTDEPRSAMVNLAESGRNKNVDMRLSSCSSLLAESNAADACTNNGVVSPVESSTDGNAQSSKFTGWEDFLSNSGRSDDWSTDVNEDDAFIEQEMEIVQQTDNAKLEETCIMVNRDEFHFVPQRQDNSRPYKKKIQGVFSSRKRSMRKQEYKQLAVHYGNDSKYDQEACVKSSSTVVSIKDANTSPAHDFFESEWELL